MPRTGWHWLLREGGVARSTRISHCGEKGLCPKNRVATLLRQAFGFRRSTEAIVWGWAYFRCPRLSGSTSTKSSYLSYRPNAHFSLTITTMYFKLCLKQRRPVKRRWRRSRIILLSITREVFKRDGDKLRNSLTNEVWDISNTTLHPLDQAGRLVQEDFCLLQSDGHHYRLTAAAVCFPANWRLSDKIGRPLNLIHEPVPGYEQNLAQVVDRFFERLQPNNLVWRANWFIHGNPILFQPGSEQAATQVTAENAGDRLWFRSERQTLQRLPESGAVLFTIRTRVIPLRIAVGMAVSARELAAVIRTMPPATLKYRRMAEIQSNLLAWLDHIEEAGYRAHSRPFRRRPL